jgi:hypothetical protein
MVSLVMLMPKRWKSEIVCMVWKDVESAKQLGQIRRMIDNLHFEIPPLVFTCEIFLQTV